MRNITHCFGRRALLWLLFFMCTIGYSHAQVTTYPAVVEDNDKPLTIFFDATQGNQALKDFDGDAIYVTTALNTWTNQPADMVMTRVEDNKYRLIMPNGIRGYYKDVASETIINQLQFCFHGKRKDALNDSWGKTADDQNIIIPVGNTSASQPAISTLYTIEPAMPTINEPVTITINASYSSNISIVDYTGEAYAHVWAEKIDGTDITGLGSSTWGDNSAKFKVTFIGNNCWKLTANSIKELLGADNSEDIANLGLLIRSQDCSKQTEDIIIPISNGPCYTAIPTNPTLNGSLTVVFDAKYSTRGDNNMNGYKGDAYVHTWLKNSAGNDVHGTDWDGSFQEKHKATYLGDSRWKLTIPNIKEYYEIEDNEIIKQIGFVFRSSDKTMQSEDIVININAVTFSPANPSINNSLTVTYDTNLENGTLPTNSSGDVYVYTWLEEATGDGNFSMDWNDKTYKAISLGNGRWQYTIDNLKDFYGETADSKDIKKLGFIFHSFVNSQQSNNLISNEISYSSAFSIEPETPTVDGSLTVVFDANYYTEFENGKSLMGHTGDVYVHTWLRNAEGNKVHEMEWGVNTDKYKATSIGDNRWKFTISNIKEFYNLGINEAIAEIGIIFRSSDGDLQSEDYYLPITSFPFIDKNPVLLTINPEKEFLPVTEKGVTFTFNTAAGNGLKNYTLTDYVDEETNATITDGIYLHTGITVNGVDWAYSTDWASPSEAFKLTPSTTNPNEYTLTIPAGTTIRDYFKANTRKIVTDADGNETITYLGDDEVIEKIGFVLRNRKGDQECKTADGKDIFIEVYPADFAIRFDKPTKTIAVKLGETFDYQLTTSQTANSISLSDGTNAIGNGASNTTTLNGSHSFNQAGTYTLTATAIGNNGETATATQIVNVYATSPTESLPEDMLPGINYNESDDTQVTLVLQAPGKQSAYVTGDFNNWGKTLMNYDGEYFWVKISGLTAGTEYAYQYIVDGNIYVADPYATKVLDPSNDKYINETVEVYPNLKEYPAAGKGIVSVLQTGKTAFAWSEFKRPATGNLMIYEIHLRDFTEEGTYKAALAKLPYLKELGVNAVELMPINEFEGNDSWGYNPSFYFAVDKAYGTEEDLKEFIDVCHQNGMAVIIDMVLNHSFGQSPLLQLYQDENGTPTTMSPWYNVKANIENSGLQWGADFNHESYETRKFVDRVNAYWIQEFKVDGIRFDFTKGFSNTPYPVSEDEWANQYDQDRIDNLKRMKEAIDNVEDGQEVNPYVICEHLTDADEEKELGKAGLMLWRNMYGQYKQAALGYNDGSDFNRTFWQTGSMETENSIVSYMESHDEQRLGYEAKTWGIDNIKNSHEVQVKQLATCAAFFLTVPGPKMIWQFGEMGYDVDINVNGRTGRKPQYWEKYDEANNKYLFDVYSKLLYLRNNYPQLFTLYGDFSAASSDYGFKWNVDDASWSGGRLIVSKCGEDGKAMVIVGNFSDSEASCYAEFTNTGTWYDYMNGGTLEVTSTEMNDNGTLYKQNVTVPAHEFRVYLNFDMGYRLAHSSDVGSSLTNHKKLKLRSGGWEGKKLHGGQTSDMTPLAKHIDMSEAVINENENIDGLFDSFYNVTRIDMPHLNFSTTNLTDGGNPNALIYVPEGTTLSSNNTHKNVIAGNQAISDIVLEHGNIFAFDEPFIASNATYTRHYIGAGKTGGWSTINLPFDATVKADEEELAPVTDTTEGNYWLMEYASESEDNEANPEERTLHFQRAADIEAYKPYLIAFPGTAWGNEGKDDWTITFTGNNVEFDNAKIAENATSEGNYTFVGTMKEIDDVATIYTLNSDENKFQKGHYSVVNPFEAYFALNPTSDASLKSVKALGIGTGNGEITGIENEQADKDYIVTGNKGQIDVRVMKAVEIAVYDVNGTQVYRQTLQEGSYHIALPQGVYVVNKQKIMVY